MSSEYYPLDKTAEMLGLTTGEVTRLRERGELRAFRDGTSWKFRKVDVDNRVAQTIRERSAAAASDPTIMASAAPDFAEVVDFDDSLDVVGDDVFELSLAPAAEKPASQAKPASEVPLAKPASSANLADDDDVFGFDSDLVLEESSSMAVLNDQSSDQSSDVELGELGLAKEMSSQIDSEPVAIQKAPADDDDDDDLLTYISEDSDIALAPASSKVELAKKPTPAAKSAAKSEPEEGFDLDTFGVDSSDSDSESASQVIAVDDTSNPFGVSDGDFGVPDFAPADEVTTPFGGETATSGGETAGGGFDPFGGGGVAVTPVATAASSVSAEPQYSWQTITFGLIPCVVLLCLSLGMILDLIMHMWSWGQPNPFSTVLLGLFGGMF
ncbi:MAG: helix-turn-helix domain-containing protein [Thermoguttaceae bacterium]